MNDSPISPRPAAKWWNTKKHGPRVMHYAAPDPRGGYEPYCGRGSSRSVTPDTRFVTCKACLKSMHEQE